MFTGISECMGTVVDVKESSGIVALQIESPISAELRIDQSVSHDGICLTVTGLHENTHWVQVIPETLLRTNCGTWQRGTQVNLERSMPANGRFDGHIVQGHVDTTAQVLNISKDTGYKIFFAHDPQSGLTVEKGSVCVNGISLTVVDSGVGNFSIALIPYTLEHTNLGALTAGDTANIEFDILGKYLQKFLESKRIVEI